MSEEYDFINQYEEEQALIDGVEMAIDYRLDIPDDDIKTYYNIINKRNQKEYLELYAFKKLGVTPEQIQQMSNDYRDLAEKYAALERLLDENIFMEIKEHFHRHYDDCEKQGFIPSYWAAFKVVEDVEKGHNYC